MPNPRNSRSREDKSARSDALPLDTQCWVLAVASTLCRGDHRPSFSGLTTVRRALTRSDRQELAQALVDLVDQQGDDLCPKLRLKLRLLIGEVRYGTNRRVRRLASEVVHLSLCSERDAC